MRTLLTSILLGGALLCASADTLPLYKNPKASVEERVEDLLSRMTLREKVLQLQNRSIGEPANFDNNFSGMSVGTVHDMDHSAREARALTDTLERYMAATRLGIPVLPCVEGIEGILQDSTTIFPQALAQGSTFNPALIERMTYACGEEALALGLHQVLSPVLDIARDPRWGRVEETFGEDPYLISEMATAFVNGYQKHPITCTPKHFVAHGTPTGGLNCSSVAGGERELRNLYLYPFRKVIANASPMAIMSCYSAYDGVPVCGSRYYMTDILRGELGFNGYVYSDWGSVDRLKSFHYVVPTSEEAARQSILAGVDLDVDDAYRTLEQQVIDGIIPMEAIDTSVRRMLAVKFRLGLFDKSPADRPAYEAAIHTPAHIALSKEVADESAVLLENKGILPLDASKLRSVAVVGPNADFPVMGDYIWNRAHQKVGASILDGLRSRLPKGVELNYAEGCDWWSQDASNIPAAVAAAEKSDVVIAAVGTRSTFLGRSPDKSTSGEGFDLSSLELPGVQLDLLKALKATGKPLIVVLVSGKPLVMTWVKDNADALLVQWYAGEEQGNTAADILLGNVNPSGRLNVSFPRSTGTNPCFYNYYPTDREYFNDHGGTADAPAMRYIFESPYALYPFGEGLSYTTFSYSDPKVSIERDRIVAEVEVTNTGNRTGKEVVQLYITDPIASIHTPVKQLKSFSKVEIPAGQTRKVLLEVPFDELKIYRPDGTAILEPGTFLVHIGSSAANIHSTTELTL